MNKYPVNSKKLYISEIKSFFICAVSFTAIFLILFKLIFGIAVIADDSMEPAFSAGDIVLYQRVFNESKAGDIVIYKAEDKTYAGCIMSADSGLISIGTEDLSYQDNEESYKYVEPEDIKGPVLACLKLSINHD